MNHAVVDAVITPEGRLDVLSRAEVNQLTDASQRELHTLLRNCALAVLNSGSRLDDGHELLARYPGFSVRVLQEERGIKLEVKGAPAAAFVDGKIIKGSNEHLFAVLRDLVYANIDIKDNPRFDLNSSVDVTSAVFHILRNAEALRPRNSPRLVVCWGGHAIGRTEYDYSKLVGYELGLRGLEICTGCGPGAMKGPMKGAAVGHAKQRIRDGQYLGITEPGIIAAESPNPIVNDLVIMPDIEKRLEAFVRAGHGIVVFPGGAGTVEEILYILSALLHPDNRAMPFPLIFTGPAHAQSYFGRIHDFVGDVLGASAQQRYRIVIDDPAGVAQAMKAGIAEVEQFRKTHGDAYYFNWLLKLDHELQQPFVPSHANMGGLALHRDQQPHQLAANLRRAFSGVVAGNVKDAGIRAIDQFGPFELRGDAGMMEQVDALLASFVAEGRMKLRGETYRPCYRVLTA